MSIGHPIIGCCRCDGLIVYRSASSFVASNVLYRCGDHSFVPMLLKVVLPLLVKDPADGSSLKVVRRQGKCFRIYHVAQVW